MIMSKSFNQIRIRNILFLFLSLFVLVPVQTFSETRVSLSSFVEPRQVPLNRNVIWAVRIEWQDALSLIEIEDFEPPALSNFDVIGSSASNRRFADQGGQTSVKEISYTLKPKTLGMGYIESAAVSYRDKATGESHHLMTQRIGVEVTDPVPEPGDTRIPWIPLLAGIGLLGGIALLVFYRKRVQAKKELESAVDQSLLEERFLAELKTDADLSAPQRNETLSAITRLFRKYVSEKYHIPALEATTSGLIRKLKESGLESTLLEKCEAMLSKADVIRFSGNEATPAELNEAYGTVEMVLESNLKSSQDQNQDDA